MKLHLQNKLEEDRLLIDPRTQKFKIARRISIPLYSLSVIALRLVDPASIMAIQNVASIKSLDLRKRKATEIEITMASQVQ